MTVGKVGEVTGRRACKVTERKMRCHNNALPDLIQLRYQTRMEEVIVVVYGCCKLMFVVGGRSAEVFSQ